MAGSERSENDATFAWRVPVSDLKRGFGVKTTSRQFMVKQAPFVIDVYIDGAHEEFRGHVAAYLRYVGREKSIRVWVSLDFSGLASTQVEGALGVLASTSIRTRLGTDNLVPTPSFSDDSAPCISCEVRVTKAGSGSAKGASDVTAKKIKAPKSSATQMARNMRFMVGVAPIVSRYMSARKRAKRVRLALKSVDRQAYYDERTLLWDTEHERAAPAIRSLFARMGGLYNKLAQDFATRDGLLPQPWVDELKGSFESLKPRPWSQMQTFIYNGLAKEGVEAIDSTKPSGSLDRYYASIEPEPLAAASIGQVHLARCHRRTISREEVSVEGDEDLVVVVKAIYPDIRKHLAADLANARRAAHFITKILKLPMKGSVDAVMDEQCESFPKEVDLRLEQENLIAAKNQFSRHRLDVVVPDVYTNLSSSSVLTQSFLRGKTLSSLDVAECSEMEKSRAVESVKLVASAIGVTMFRERVFHSDPHPGNIMLLDDGRPALIDWGQCTLLTPAQLRTLCHIVLLLHTKSAVVIERALQGSDINFNTENTEFKLALLYYFFDSSRDVSSVVRPQATEFLMDAIQHNPRIMPVMTDVPREVVFYGRVCGTLRKSFELLGTDVSVLDLWYNEARDALKRLNALQPDMTSTGLLLLPDDPTGLVYIMDRSPDWIKGALSFVSGAGSQFGGSQLISENGQKDESQAVVGSRRLPSSKDIESHGLVATKSRQTYYVLGISFAVLLISSIFPGLFGPFLGILAAVATLILFALFLAVLILFGVVFVAHKYGGVLPHMKSFLRVLVNNDPSDDDRQITTAP